MIRYFCHTGRTASFEYYLALRELELPIRIIATDFANILSRSVWAEHGEDFVTAVTEPYINVVCGDKDELARFWTKGVKNIAIPVDDSTDIPAYDAIVREAPGTLVSTIRKLI